LPGAQLKLRAAALATITTEVSSHNEIFFGGPNKVFICDELLSFASIHAGALMRPHGACEKDD
jgi:hypothetical protein